jgi:hypothetical protein
MRRGKTDAAGIARLVKGIPFTLTISNSQRLPQKNSFSPSDLMLEKFLDNDAMSGSQLITFIF